MAKSRTTRPRRHTDRHGQSQATTWAADPISAMCSVGRCAGCRGVVLSLLYPQDQRCEHACHQVPVPDAWKPAGGEAA